MQARGSHPHVDEALEWVTIALAGSALGRGGSVLSRYLHLPSGHARSRRLQPLGMSRGIHR